MLAVSFYNLVAKKLELVLRCFMGHAYSFCQYCLPAVLHLRTAAKYNDDAQNNYTYQHLGNIRPQNGGSADATLNKLNYIRTPINRLEIFLQIIMNLLRPAMPDHFF